MEQEAPFVYFSTGMYSVSGANELRLWIRLRGIVNLKGNSFKIQVSDFNQNLLSLTCIIEAIKGTQ